MTEYAKLWEYNNNNFKDVVTDTIYEEAKSNLFKSLQVFTKGKDC